MRLIKLRYSLMNEDTGFTIGRHIDEKGYWYRDINTLMTKRDEYNISTNKYYL